MKPTLSIAALASLLAFLSALAIQLAHIDVYDFYSKNMRGSLFSGFLTLGGFLLSLKTFVVVKMKEGLYDNKAYRTRHKRRQTLLKTDLYNPLINLSHLLYYSILACIATSVSQLTLGLFPRWWSAAGCASLATFAVVLLAMSLREIKGNLDTWFECLEEEYRKSENPQEDQTG
ncbi:hypothetical protein [Corallococcus interemptor]|uniref:hypothetical protein n=1 Tax=Corallococcus interemptor TaxID=2316720 RepID=UPI0011C4670B|nr:hypothetical protein [Corallococcus interemptor]